MEGRKSSWFCGTDLRNTLSPSTSHRPAGTCVFLLGYTCSVHSHERKVYMLLSPTLKQRLSNTHQNADGLFKEMQSSGPHFFWLPGFKYLGRLPENVGFDGNFREISWIFRDDFPKIYIFSGKTPHIFHFWGYSGRLPEISRDFPGNIKGTGRWSVNPGKLHFAKFSNPAWTTKAFILNRCKRAVFPFLRNPMNLQYHQIWNTICHKQWCWPTKPLFNNRFSNWMLRLPEDRIIWHSTHFRCILQVLILCYRYYRVAVLKKKC